MLSVEKETNINLIKEKEFQERYNIFIVYQLMYIFVNIYVFIYIIYIFIFEFKFISSRLTNTFKYLNNMYISNLK